MQYFPLFRFTVFNAWMEYNRLYSLFSRAILHGFLFRDRAIDHHHDPVGAAHRRQAVRDHNCGASRDKMIEGILHQTLGIRIERRRWLRQESKSARS